MKQYGRALAQGASLLALAVLLFSFPDESVEAARSSITLCLDLLIPSLFPFFVLSSLFISTGLAGACARSLEKLMIPLLGVSGAGAAALILGVVGGYPVGARTLAQLVSRKECSQKEAQRLSLFCNNCGPAFFIGAAGVGVFGSKEAGFLLLGANLTASILIGLGLHLFCGRVTSSAVRPAPAPVSSLSSELPDCVRSSFASSLNVCAYVILFSVLTALADCSGILTLGTSALAAFFSDPHAPALCRSFLVGLLELSTGTAALSESISSAAALPLAAFILGWGGLSVHCQSLPFWQKAGVRPGPYLVAKLLQGILSAGLTVLGTRLFPLSLPVMAPVTSLAVPNLLGREILALWGLSGVYFFLFGKKGMEKTPQSRYNTRKP